MKQIDIIDEDDDISYPEFSKHLKMHTERTKQKHVTEILIMGNDFIDEIEKKKTRENIEKKRLIKYIQKKDKKKFSFDELYNYSLEDVRVIYNEAKLKKSKTITIINTLLGLD